MKPKKEPIFYIDKEKGLKLFGKKILAAQHKEGLGYYGILRGCDDKTGKFLVEIRGKLFKFNWIVEYN